MSAIPGVRHQLGRREADPVTWLLQTGPMRALLSLLLLATALVLVSGAAADGDPASDVLIASSVFMPYPPPPAAAVRPLATAINAVELKGDRVKVAVIATAQDLGSVPSLYGHPQDYAKFLSLELAFIYKGPLLVVMPGGFGFVDKSRPVSKATATVAGVRIDSPSATDLTLAAAQAVTALEHAGLLHYTDTYAPQASPASATVIAGRRLALRYQVWDDSGRAKVAIELRNQRNVVVSRLRVPLRSVAQGAWYFVVWRAPLALAHSVLAYCIQATDFAGNHSHLTCAKLTVA